MANRKTTTSNEVKQRWKTKTYKAYQVNLRKDEDAELIEFVEQLRGRIGTSDIFRIGVQTIKERDFNAPQKKENENAE